MDVKTFVIARHGHYSVCSKDENLSESGIQQTSAAASAVAEVCKDKKGIVIVSADTTRVVETAKIYGEYFPGALVKYSKNLRSAWTSPLEVLKDEEVLAHHEVVIIVTHMDVAQKLQGVCAEMLQVKIERSTFEEYGSYKIIK